MAVHIVEREPFNRRYPAISQSSGRHPQAPVYFDDSNLVVFFNINSNHQPIDWDELVSWWLQQGASNQPFVRS